MVIPNRYTFLNYDINDLDSMRKAMKYMPNCIINCAAESHVDRSIVDPSGFFKTNIMGAANVMAAGLEYYNTLDEADKKNFFHIQIGTDESYGSLEYNNNKPFTSDSALYPNSPYSASKTSADLIARSYYKTYRYPIAVTRSSNNYGPWQHPEKLIPRTIRYAMNDIQPQIYGDGKNSRDWLYVEDNVQCIYQVAKNAQPGTVINIGTGIAITNNQVVDIILRAMGKPNLGIDYIIDRPGHDMAYSIDPRSALDAVDWRFQVGFSEGIYKTVSWYLDHKEWLEQSYMNEGRTWKSPTVV